MIAPYAAPVRQALLSVAIGLAGAVGLVASGWALQASALQAPTPSDRVLADASVWLGEHRLVVDRFRFGGRWSTAACLRGWFRRDHGAQIPGELIAAGSRSVVLFSEGGKSWLLAGSRPRVPSRLAVAAGCSGDLELLLARAAQSGDRVSVERAWAAQQPALALEVARGEHGHLTMYVSPRTFRPLVVVAYSDALTVKARLYLPRARRMLLRRFHLSRWLAR